MICDDTRKHSSVTTEELKPLVDLQKMNVCVMCFRFICLYPIYINSKKTLAEGRRIPAEKVTLCTFYCFHDVSPSVFDSIFLIQGNCLLHLLSHDSQGHKFLTEE